MEYYSAIKKWNNAISAIWVALEIIILSEVSQRKSNIIYHLYVESKKYDTNELIYKTETESQISKSNLSLPKGRHKFVFETSESVSVLQISLFVSFFKLGSTYEWYHMIFVFLCLTYFTLYDNL